MNKFNKILDRLYASIVKKIMYINTHAYMSLYVKYLKKNGMRFNGFPNYISNDVYFDGKDYSIIKLGNGCTISREVLFLTHDYSRHTILRGIEYMLDEDILNRLKKKDDFDKLLVLDGIEVGDNSFIGARSMLLPGTRIGNNVIVGAGSVVKGTIPDNVIVFGNPAKIYNKSHVWLSKQI